MGENVTSWTSGEEDDDDEYSSSDDEQSEDQWNYLKAQFFAKFWPSNQH
jgi:hypothetical protein